MKNFQIVQHTRNTIKTLKNLNKKTTMSRLTFNPTAKFSMASFTPPNVSNPVQIRIHDAIYPLSAKWTWRRLLFLNSSDRVQGGASNKNGKIIEKKVSTLIDRHTAGKCTGRSADFDGPSLFWEKVNSWLCVKFLWTVINRRKRGQEKKNIFLIWKMLKLEIPSQNGDKQKKTAHTHTHTIYYHP